MSSKKPQYEAFSVRDDATGNSWWTKIGAAWVYKDGTISVQLSALPINDKILLREPKAKDEGQS